MTITPSSIEDINNKIKDENPFDISLVVKESDIWNNNFPDCPSIHAYASDTIFDEIRKVDTGKRTSIGITITAEKGLGKSHIISRIRQRLQDERISLFIYMADFSDLSQLKSIFLKTLVRSLNHDGSEKVSQWQEIATELVNDVFKKQFEPQSFVNILFPRIITKRLEQGKSKTSYIIELRDQILANRPDITDQPYLIQALLWTLDKSNTYFATNWLCGQNLTKIKSDEMDLPNHSKEFNEGDSFHLVCQLVNLISIYKTIVICFDELDGVGDADIFDTRAMVAASLIKDIYNLTKKGVFLTVMYPQTLKDQVKTMSQADAVVDRIGEKIIDLKYLNSDEVVNLVTIWLKNFYDQMALVPLHPLYPFHEMELRDLGKEKPTIRKILEWCKNNFKVSSLKHPVEDAFNKEFSAIQTSINNYLEDKDIIANAIRLCILSLVNQTVAEVSIDKIEDFVFNAKEKNNSPDFKIVGKEKGETIKIGLMVQQTSNSSSVQAGLKRLVEYDKLDINCACLIRSKDISITAQKTQACLVNLKKKGGKQVKLIGEDIKPILAIYLVYMSHIDYELSKEEIIDFINIKRLALDNSLIINIFHTSISY